MTHHSVTNQRQSQYTKTSDLLAPVIRTFETGADRDTDTRKPDYEGFLSPLALREYARYMHAHRTRQDGTLRDSDNWQRGFPIDSYMKSMFRHFMDVWTLHRGYPAIDADGNAVELKEALASLLFNVHGMLHELCKEESA